jgi:uncharacterized hydrophobic protein (TIGR00271 family)
MEENSRDRENRHQQWKEEIDEEREELRLEKEEFRKERQQFREEMQAIRKERQSLSETESETTETKKQSRLAEWKALTGYMFSLTKDSASHEEIRERLLSGGRVSGTNMCVMVCAILIASVGLNTNSTAVIIGAMLISPLMGSILAIAYGTVSANPSTVRKYATGFLFQILFSVAASTIYFVLSPRKAVTQELLNRTSPSLYDVIIATAGGIAGIIGQTRKDKSNNIIPGVAIATALMPPLCTCGYAIANGNWKMLGSAAYLFIINGYFIYLSSCVVLVLLKIPRTRNVTEARWNKKKRRMYRNAVLVCVPAVIFGLFVHFGG